MKKAEGQEVGLRTVRGAHVVQTHFWLVNPLFREKAAPGLACGPGGLPLGKCGPTALWFVAGALRMPKLTPAPKGLRVAVESKELSRQRRRYGVDSC